MIDKMNLIIIPFNDWRKRIRFGASTRDLHIIEQLAKNEEVGKIIIVNRPITWAEVVLKKTPWKTPGVAIYETNNLRLSQVNEKIYVFDYLSYQLVHQIILGRRWYFDSYGSENYVKSIFKACEILDVQKLNVISFSLYAFLLCESIRRLAPNSRIMFDGWDNFLRFPSFSKHKKDFERGYKTYQKNCDSWITNSDNNKEFYQENFAVKKCYVIRNGVDPDRFQREYTIPCDMKNIQRPIVGFGGKISHLLDVDLLNYLIESNPSYSFVIIGQVLDKDRFNKIVNRPNYHYLGNKHYDEYPAYITNFDVCILPYHIKERAHRGDSIKLYEYLAAKKPVVATNDNGAELLTYCVNIADSREKFSELIQKCVQGSNDIIDIPEEFTWKYKAQQFVEQLLNE